MRKIHLIFFAFLLFFFGNTIKIEAEITYDIESIVVSNDTITIKGWGYMRRVNNVGGNTLSLSVTATTGGVGTSGITTNVKNYEYQDLYSIMCVRTLSGNKCHPKSESSSRCTAAADYDGCLYDNGKFTVSFGLKKLYEKFGKNEIFFDLNVNVSGSSETIRIGAYTGNVKNSSSKWNATVKASDSVYIAVKSNPFMQTSIGTRYKPEQKWAENNSFHVNLYSKVTFKPTVDQGFAKVDIGTYCNTYGQCAYASWVRTSNVFSLKLEEDDQEKTCDNINANLSCDESYDFNSDCDSKVTDTINGGWAMAEEQISSNAEICWVETSTDLTTNVNFEQNGKLSFFNPIKSVYSGGFFTFNIDYINSIVWNYKKEPVCPSLSVNYIISGDQYECGLTMLGPIYCPCNCDVGQCVVESSYYSDECPQGGYRGSDTEEDIEVKIQSKYKEISEDLTVSLPDSSPIESRPNNLFDVWKCDNADPSTWEEGVPLISTCKYELPNAWINKETSEIKYTLDSGPNNNYIIKEHQYATALKQPTGTVYIEMSFPELSVIPTITRWTADYKCGINCQQKLYDLDNGGYLYYFRPISLNTPFPNRDPGRNWFEWIEEGGDLERLAETYTSNDNIEYYVTLSNNDIANIKQYNYNANYNGGKGYLDLDIGDNFDINGNSKFIRDYNYFTLGNVNHSGLGVFNPEEDMQ